MKDYIVEKSIKYRQKKTSIFTTGVFHNKISAIIIDKTPHKPTLLKIKYPNTEQKPLYALIDLCNLNKYAQALGFKLDKKTLIYYRDRYSPQLESKRVDYLSYERV